MQRQRIRIRQPNHSRIDVYGGLSREFLDKHFLSHYKTKKAEAKAAGTSTWEVLREKEERVAAAILGVAIAKGNRHMIATAQTARGY